MLSSGSDTGLLDECPSRRFDRSVRRLRFDSRGQRELIAMSQPRGSLDKEAALIRSDKSWSSSNICRLIKEHDRSVYVS